MQVTFGALGLERGGGGGGVKRPNPTKKLYTA